MKESHRNFSPRKFAFVAPALLLAALFLPACVVGVRAQDGDATAQTPEVRREVEARRRGGGAGAAGLFRALNLSPEQRAQIAAIRRETEPQGRLLGARLRQARRALDEAIYSANPDERVVEERARELAAAQAAVVRLRTFTELKIRRVLSPEQLNTFRRLQRQPRRRPNQPSPQQQDDFPDGDAAAPPATRLRNRIERRRRQEQQQQQLPSPNDPNAPPPSATREQQRPAALRDARPPQR